MREEAPAVFAIGGVILLVMVLSVIFLAVGFTVLRMLSMCLDGEISVAELLVWLFVYLAAFAMAFASWGSPLFGPVILLCLFLAAAYPVGNYLIEMHGRQRMRTMDIAAYSRAAEEHPNNPYPLKRLGDLFFASCDYELAIKHYEQYLARVKDGGVARRIERARELIRQSSQETRLCSSCAALNPKGATHCIECGEPLPGVWEFLEPFRGRKAIGILLWTAGLAMAAGLGVVLIQVLTERFFPLLYCILVPFLLLVAVTSLFVYLYVRMSD